MLVNTITISKVGVIINLSLSRLSSRGAICYHVMVRTGAETVTGNVLIASQAATIIFSATKQGDQQYASTVSGPTTFTFTE